MKIYTKTGDKGETSLFGGQRVSKDHIRVEAYGTVDELNAYIGLLRDMVDSYQIQNQLTGIQNELFVLGSMLATPLEKQKFKNGKNRLQIATITVEKITLLEKQIDDINAALQPMTHFILPGGHPVVSHCHIARNVCRRAERRVVQLSHKYPVQDVIITYLNRLSDYLFVLARKLSKDLGVKEIIWNK